MSMPVRTFVMRAPRIEPRLERGPDPAESAALPARAHPTSDLHTVVSRRRAYPGSGHTGRGDEPGATDADAKQFAGYALRLVLEVLNGKRVATVLARVLDPELVNVMRSYCRGTAPMPGRNLGAARMPVIEVHRAAPDQVEFYGTYLRGARKFAVAGRVTHTRRGWRVSALQLA
jgi:hypothetical protein